MLEQPWRIQLLGGLKARQGEHSVERFRTYKTGALLAFLALHQERLQSREEIAELLWPGKAPEIGRNSLRVALTSLRHHLEPPGTPVGVVLIADRAHLRLNPRAATTDVAEFDAALQAAARAAAETEQISFLATAVDLYQGALLPGYDELWVETERHRLAEAYLGALRQLVRLLSKERPFDRAIAYARQAVQADPFREEAHHDLMRLYAAAGQPSAALHQFQELERLLQEHLDVTPSAATRQFAAQLREKLGHGTGEGRVLVSTATEPDAPSAAAEAFPAPAPSAPPVGYLPVQFTRFFGREEETARLLELLNPEREPEEARGSLLVTLAGSGGNGKTRLAIEVASRLKAAFREQVWFVPLADLTEARRLPEAISGVLRLQPSADREPLEQIAERLSPQPTLLILDNFEHLVEEGGPILEMLREQVAPLTLLVTSRRTLGLPGERVFTVEPLPTPPGAEPAERLAQWASVRLFVDRAQAVRPDFQITPRNAEAVATLCTRLEGIPLAIEMAAARVIALSPAQLLEQLSQRFALLANRRASLGARHRSLWATIDWSYRLLSPKLRLFFTQLSVFRGGWTLEAARQVCEVSDPASVLDDLEQLRTDSLIVSQEAITGKTRFRMLETLRAFAQEQLQAGEHARLLHRMAVYFQELICNADPATVIKNFARWMDFLDTEHDNLRRVLEWCLEEGKREEGDIGKREKGTGKREEDTRQGEEDRVNTDVTPASSLPPAVIGLQLAGALWYFWNTRGHLREGAEWLSKALAHPEAQARTAARAKALNGLGNLMGSLGDAVASRANFETCLTLERELGNRPGMAAVLNNLGNLLRSCEDYAASRACLEESLAIWRDLNNTWGIAGTEMNLGQNALMERSYTTAHTLFREALELFREQDNRVAAAMALYNLGVADWYLGVQTAARAFCEESLETFREVDDRPHLSEALNFLAMILLEQGDLAAARRCYRESLTLATAMEDPHSMAIGLIGLGALALKQEQPRQAGLLFGAAERLHQQGRALQPPHRDFYERSVAQARPAPGDTDLAAAWEQGQALSLNQAVACALGGPDTSRAD